MEAEVFELQTLAAHVEHYATAPLSQPRPEFSSAHYVSAADG